MADLIQPVRGMNDVLPADAPLWDRVESTAAEIFAAYGYQRVRLPVLERTELFSRSIGELTDIVEKEMYTFADRGGDRLSLRPEATAGLRALLVNEPEVRFLTGMDDAEQAARRLAAHGTTVVVTLGARGAMCAGGDGVVRADAPAVTTVDTNGAGDLFTAAWVWADLAGAPVEDRLRLAVTYASLSVRVATTHAGALTVDAFRREAGLPDAMIPRPGARR